MTTDWREVGARIRLAMGPDPGWREAFLAAYTRQAALAGVRLLRKAPEHDGVPLSAVVAGVGQELVRHAQYLSGLGDLTDDQAERLMAATQEGYARLQSAFQTAGGDAAGQTKDQIVARIESALAG